MRTKHLFAVAVAAAFAASCSNEEFAEMQTGFSGEMIDASGLQLVGTKGSADETRVNYMPQYITIDTDGKLVAHPNDLKWSEDDEIGFSHIYGKTNELITNYKFTIKNGVGEELAAFETDNSTIFAGKYFVYYPFDENYADYFGIPFAIEPIQTQNAAKPIQVVGEGSEPDAGDLKDAGEHLARFSVSGDATEIEAKTTQTDFYLTQYTTTLGFIIYPKNQSNDIYVNRIEMVTTDDATPLEIPTSVRFNADANYKAVPEVKTNEKKFVLLFENTEAEQYGLKIKSDASLSTASLGYMAMLPAGYTAGTYKFVVYYTELGSLMKREITPSKDLNLTSNKPVFVKLELDAEGATQAISTDIYTEAEFRSAVEKSNAVTNGSGLSYEIKKDLTLKNSYNFTSKVPVEFTGDKKINLTSNNKLTFSADGAVTFSNDIVGTGANAGVVVEKGNVTINSVGCDKDANVVDLTVGGGALVLDNDGKKLGAVTETGGELTLSNATAASFENTEGVFAVENVTVKHDFKNNVTTADADANTLKDVTVEGNFTNSAGDLTLTDCAINGTWNSAAGDMEVGNVAATGDVTVSAGEWTVSGQNSLGYAATTPVETVNKFGVAAGVTIVAKDATIAAGNVENKGTMTLDGKTTVTANGTSALADGLIMVGADAAYVAEGDVTGLVSDGTEGASTLILEGELKTMSKVTLAGVFRICGTVTNAGTWTLDSKKRVEATSHSHGDPAFINNGTVTVEGIDDAEDVAKVAEKVLSSDLYATESTGALIWTGIDSFKNLNEIVNLEEGCYATDLHVSRKSDESETYSNDDLADFSQKNIVITLDAAILTINLSTADDAAQFAAKNLTVRMQCKNDAAFAEFRVENGRKNAVNVTNTLRFENLGGNKSQSVVSMSTAKCRDLEVIDNNKTYGLTIENGYYIKYSNSYTTSGTGAAIVSYPNNIPQKN